MGNGISQHIRGNVVGYVALFFALSASAYALPGTNTVDTADIVNGQVRTNDIGAGQVGTTDLANGSIGSGKVADNSLNGVDVAESTLGQVPSAVTATSATTAANADTLDSLNSTDFLGTNAQAGGDLGGPFSSLQIAGNAVGTSEVLDGGIGTSDLAGGSVNSAKVADRSLTGADVGKAAGVNAINFGSIGAGSCAGSAVSPGVDPDGEVVVVTPSEEIDNNGKLAISAQDSNVAGLFVVNACNVTGAAIDPPSASFSWVVFDI